MLAIGHLEAPADVVAGLKEIDPLADLIHLQGDEWLLGVYSGNAAASDKLNEALAQLHPMVRAGVTHEDRAIRARRERELGMEFALLQFMASTGFKPIHLYTTDGRSPDHRIVQDFRERDHNWRTRPDEAFAEIKEEVSLEDRDAKRTDLIREYVQSEMGSWHKHVFRKAKSFLNPGKIEA